jgi:hypothetical protein
MFSFVVCGIFVRFSARGVQKHLFEKVHVHVHVHVHARGAEEKTNESDVYLADDKSGR